MNRVRHLPDLIVGALASSRAEVFLQPSTESESDLLFVAHSHNRTNIERDSLAHHR